MGSNRRILKFTVNPDAESTEIRTAGKPVFLAVGAQGDAVVVWAEATVGVGFSTFLVPAMTGHEPPDGTYIGTAQVGLIVVHVYAV